jgi:hypothetical protein
MNSSATNMPPPLNSERMSCWICGYRELNHTELELPLLVSSAPSQLATYFDTIRLDPMTALKRIFDVKDGMM